METTMPHTPQIFTGDLSPAMRELFLSGRFLSVDTETRGLRVHRDRLCLVQMCNEEGQVALVRTTEATAPNLQAVLESPQVEKIFHFARFDLATLHYWLGIRVNPVFCTKIASRLARTYTDRHGLKDLARELLELEMDKEQQSSDWANPALSDKQIAYASSDVLYLIALRNRLETMLNREGLLPLARESMAFLPTRVALDLAGWEEDIFAHV